MEASKSSLTPEVCREGIDIASRAEKRSQLIGARRFAAVTRREGGRGRARLASRVRERWKSKDTAFLACTEGKVVSKESRRAPERLWQDEFRRSPSIKACQIGRPVHTATSGPGHEEGVEAAGFPATALCKQGQGRPGQPVLPTARTVLEPHLARFEVFLPSPLPSGRPCFKGLGTGLLPVATDPLKGFPGLRNGRRTGSGDASRLAQKRSCEASGRRVPFGPVPAQGRQGSRPARARYGPHSKGGLQGQLECTVKKGSIRIEGGKRSAQVFDRRSARRSPVCSRARAH